MTKPSRSDEVLDAAKQEQIYSQVRAHFDSIAPKRPVKPNRSEPEDSSNGHVNSASDCDFNHIHDLELEKLQSLQHQPHSVLSHHRNEEQEFVETQYYGTLVSIDKQHHTTGTGFIKVATDDKINNGHVLDHQAINGIHDQNGYYKHGETATMFKSNPATNDWIPNVNEYQVGYVSTLIGAKVLEASS